MLLLHCIYKNTVQLGKTEDGVHHISWGYSTCCGISSSRDFKQSTDVAFLEAGGEISSILGKQPLSFGNQASSIFFPLRLGKFSLHLHFSIVLKVSTLFVLLC